MGYFCILNYVKCCLVSNDMIIWIFLSTSVTYYTTDFLLLAILAVLEEAIPYQSSSTLLGDTLWSWLG